MILTSPWYVVAMLDLLDGGFKMNLTISASTRCFLVSVTDSLLGKDGREWTIESSIVILSARGAEVTSVIIRISSSSLNPMGEGGNDPNSLSQSLSLSQESLLNKPEKSNH